MSSSQGAWIFLLILSIMMIIIGIQGNLGTTFAIIFCPSKVMIGSET